MALDYDLNPSPLIPGVDREFTWQGAGTLAGEIRCFVKNPPPPGYKPCDACGSFALQSGMSTIIHADYQVFFQFGGTLEIEIIDDFGFRETITLLVNRRNDGSFEVGGSGASGSGGIERMIEEES